MPGQTVRYPVAMTDWFDQDLATIAFKAAALMVLFVSVLALAGMLIDR